MLLLYLVGCGEKKILDSGDNTLINENIDDSEEFNIEETQESEGNETVDGDTPPSDYEDQVDEEETEEDSEQEPEEEQENSQTDNTNEESMEETEEEENHNTGESSNEGENHTGNEICSIDNLLWNVRVVDDSDSSISPYSTTSSLSIIGEVTNTCDGEVIISTMTDCIVYSGTLYANSGLGTHIWTNACQVFSTSWVFGPFETKSQTETIAPRPEDHYELTIYFADSGTTMVQYSFDIE